MKALVARAYGPLEHMAFEDLPTPVPGPGEVLVRTRAAALNAEPSHAESCLTSESGSKGDTTGVR